MKEHPSGPSPVNRERTGPSFASVIVLAHNRKQFVLEAVKSVLVQDIDRKRYEIIVVKNFHDETIDSILSQSGVCSIYCDATPTTQKANEGFRASKGDVLLFLDDDDLFEPSRLRVILKRFDEHRELGFYRNQVTPIGVDGAILSPEVARSHGVRAPKRNPSLYIETDQKFVHVLRLAGVSPDFNSSSMAIRRELFELGTSYLPCMSTTLDTLLWFEGLASDCSVLIDSQSLTRYRIHDSNVSLARGQTRNEREANMLEASRSHARDYGVIRDFVASTGRKAAIHEIEARLVTSHLTELLRNPLSGRMDFLRLYLATVPYSDTATVWRAAAEFRASLLYLLAPRLARRLYLRSIGIW